MKHLFSWLLSVCLLVCSFHSYAQTPRFSVDINAGCSPLPPVTFTNQSTGFSSAAKYEINFGDSRNNLPFTTTASHTYTVAQGYVATLTVTDNGTSYTDTLHITVYKNPVVDFVSDLPKACVNSAINFTSTSTPGDSTIRSYSWDFGDGVLFPDTTAQSIQHQYTSARNPNANVTLTVTNNYGCSASKTKNNIVTLLAAPKASFMPNQTSVCNENDPVILTNTTTGGSLPTTYLWSFNDGFTTTDVSPTHVYGVKGTFNVKLIATSADGCSDVPQVTVITVASSKSGITLPTLLCLNTNLTFQDSSFPQTNTPTWLLDGKVVASNVHQYTNTFTDTKTHTLQLINNYGACTDTVTKIIQAQAAPVPSPFTVNIPGYCSLPANATFTDAGAGSAKWEWDFNNVNEAKFIPTAFTKSAPYTYSAEGTYYVKLRVTDASGCTGEIRQPVTIKKNKTTVASTKGVFGCKTLATTFKATSTNPVASYSWTFSDDNSTSILDTPQHIYVKYGTFTAFVKVTTAGGCEDTASAKIHIGDAPAFDFTPGTDTTVCGNSKVIFKVTGDTNRLVGVYYWNFGDVKSYIYLSGPTYLHQYTADGTYSVSLVINNNGCADTVTKSNYLTVLPPFPDIAPAVNNCDDRLNVTLKENSTKAATYSWDFGDKTPVYTYDSLHRDTSVTHRFATTGNYKVVLTTTSSSGCIAKDSVYAKVLQNQNPVLSAKQSSLCGNDLLETTISGMENSPYGNTFRNSVKAVEYENGSPFTGSYSILDIIPPNPFYVNISGLTPGNQKVRIITNSFNFNCPDTTNYVPVQVNGPMAGFQLANNTFCLSDRILFADTSKASSSAPIKTWQWFFGDSASQTLTSGGSIFHKYSDPGSFTAKLIVTDAQNCADTAYFSDNSLTINGPKARFSVEQNPILPNTPEIFTNLTDSGYDYRANNGYQWDFGDGGSSTSNSDNVSHSYKLYSDDTVKLVATSSVTGCSDTATSIVHVKNTNLSFTYALQNANAICPPVQINFQNTSVNFDLVSWDFGDGRTADNINAPSHVYNSPGTYKVTIFGYYNDNNYDSTWDYITIAGPIAILHADVVPGCGSKQVIFTAQTQNTTSLSWDFQDGTSSKDSIVNHTYTTPNIYTPVLTVRNGSSCLFSYPLSTSIVIDSLHINLSQDSLIECHQLLVNFKPDVFSIAKNNGETLNYKWQFGTGTDSSSLDTTSFTYTKPGTYPVTFVASSQYGCTDTVTTQVTFTDIPHASIQGPSEFCEGTSQKFSAVNTNAGDVLTYNWQFENGTSTVQNPPAQTFSAAWKDSIRLVVGYNNCTDTIYHPLVVHGQPQVTVGISDSTVCSGTTVTFSAKPANNSQETLTYKWSYGDGKSTTDSVTTYLYGKPGVYTPSLSVKNVGGCLASLTPADKVVIDTMSLSINKDSVIQCHQLLVNFLPSIFSTAKNNGETLTYNWKFGDGVSTSAKDTTAFTYTKSNTYTATFIASSPEGCTDTATTQVTFTDSNRAAITGTTEFCENTPQVFKAVKVNPADPLTYNWQFENGTSTVQNPPAQTFSAAWKDSIRLIVDNKGCKDTIYQALNIHMQPNVSIKLSDSIACLGTAVLFTAKQITTIPEAVTYVWDFGGGNGATQPSSSFTFSNVGNYPISLLATSAFGCSEMVKDTVTVAPVPTASITAPADICIGGTANFTGNSTVASSTYFWHFTDGATSPKQNADPKTYTKSTTDDLYLVASVGSCHDTAFHKLTVHNLPLPNIATSASRICLGSSAQLTAHNGQTYQWINATAISDPSVANPFVSPSSDTRYDVLVTDSYGCKNTDSIIIQVTQPQTLIAASSLDACFGSKAYLTAAGTDVFNWIDGADLNSVSIANPTTTDSAQNRTYTVVGSDKFGCFHDTAVIQVVVREKPVVDANPNKLSIPAGTSGQLAATATGTITSWSWQPALYLSCTDCASPVTKPRDSVAYVAVATNNYGCKGSDTVLVTVVCKESLVNVPQIFSPNGDGINDRFRLTGIGIKTINHIVVYSRTGEKLFERNNVSPLDENASWDGKSDNNYMPTGTYVYMIQAVCDAGEVYNLQGTITIVR